MTAELHLDAFPRSWSARMLTTPPLIAPARSFMYPQDVPGEEEALHRGALLAEIRPENASPFLATCALGFHDPTLPTGLWSTPSPTHLLALAGGYGYRIDTGSPANCDFLPQRPITAVLAAPDRDLLLLAGFHTVAALGPAGILWTSGRLSWEGLTHLRLESPTLHGLGWDMFSDRELPFELDLRTGIHTGGGFLQR